jgi:hypothetical protein
MPERQDYEEIERTYGPLRPDASIEERARRYFLAAAAEILREWRRDEQQRDTRHTCSADSFRAPRKKPRRRPSRV